MGWPSLLALSCPIISRALVKSTTSLREGGEIFQNFERMLEGGPGACGPATVMGLGHELNGQSRMLKPLLFPCALKIFVLPGSSGGKGSAPERNAVFLEHDVVGRGKKLVPAS